MKKSSIRKDFYMEIKKTLSRFISIMLIVSLGVAFYTGVRSAEPDMKLSADKLYDENKMPDIRVLSNIGMTNNDVNIINGTEGVKEAYGIYYHDFISNIGNKQNVIKIYGYNSKINVPVIENGRLPENENECMISTLYFDNNELKLGDKITFKSGEQYPTSTYITNDEFTIVGTFCSAYYLGMDYGSSTIGTGSVDALAYVLPKVFVQPIYSEVYVLTEDGADYVSYKEEYDDYVNDIKENINKEYEYVNSLPITTGTENTDIIAETNDIQRQLYVLDRNSIQTYVEYSMDAERVGNVGKVIPIVFFIVAALVSLTTMTRMVEEQRTQIGTLKALGYSKLVIAGKYFLYGFLSSVLGGVIGGILGSYIFPRVIINAYKIMYKSIGEMVSPINKEYFVVALIVAVLCVEGATLLACYKELRESPANLMRPVSPKQGKKILLERIPFIWKRINFSRKSTIRNLVRYKKRLFMTLFGISGCMGLLLVGFGIKDSISSIVTIQYDELHKYGGIMTIEGSSTKEDMDEVLSFLDKNDVDSIQTMVMTMTATNGTDNVTADLFVPEDKDKIEDYITFRDRKSHDEYSLTDNTVIINEKLAKLLEVKVGDTIELKPNEYTKYEVEVGAIVENYVYHYVFMSKELYSKLFSTDVVYNELLLESTDYNSTRMDEFANELISFKAIGGSSFIDNMKTKFQDMLQGLDIIILVIIVSAGGLAIVVLYNLNNINITERIRELATLKVLGFYDSEVSMYIYRENIVISFFGIIFGIIFGLILHSFVISTVEVDIVMFAKDVLPLSYVYSILITLVFAVFINLTMHYKIKKIDMATSLKSVE